MNREKIDDIYRVESIPLRNTDIANKLLENGWQLLGVEEQANLSVDGIPEKLISMLLGASKDIFEKYNLDDATPKSQYDNLF